MNRATEIILLLSIASWGVFAGAMLTEGCVLVPYWRSLSPAKFYQWYAENAQRLLGFFSPLTITTALLALAAAATSLYYSHPNRWLTLLAAGLALAVVSSFYVYFKHANASFSARSLSDEKLVTELARWATWHWWRTGMSLLALTLTILCRLLDTPLSPSP